MKYDVMHYGWEGDKFVLLVIDSDGTIKHRISLNKEEAWFVRDEIDQPTNKVLKYELHRQVDTAKS